MAAAPGAGSTAGDTSGDCEGEEQEDPSSSSPNEVLEVGSELENLTVQDNSQNTGDDELAAFRQQWQRELEATVTPQRELSVPSTPQKEPPKPPPPPEPVSEEEKVGTTSSDMDTFKVFLTTTRAKPLVVASQKQQPPEPISEEEKVGTTSSNMDILLMIQGAFLTNFEVFSTTTRAKPLVVASQKQQLAEPASEEEKAKQLFLNAVELERGGKLYEAIQHYKRAMQILPDVETRLYDELLSSDSPEEEESEAEEVVRPDNAHPSDDEDAVEGEDLLMRLQRILARRGVLCEPEHQAKGAHISWLPYEVIMVILRWVVSAELDAAALERVAAVCRGLYVAAREPDIWRSLCVKTWGIECGTPRASGFASWRQMFVQRPRVQLNGVYISKTTYIRHGENSFQDQFYKPWYLIDYYRYLRFFSEGLVLMYTTAEEPATCVQHLRYRHVKPGLGVMAGHYRLIGDKVLSI
ncbi:hypothetical protein PYW07_016397 [Mythimna separata]|uniref:F-box only protein 9 n=1 Tax=Mythimna separata TaxID=271217 RepID=A0AAD7YJK3_MYTSE|nr:hypothetical protein PYW07_016397 [Mythimna separata]